MHTYIYMYIYCLHIELPTGKRLSPYYLFYIYIHTYISIYICNYLKMLGCLDFVDTFRLLILWLIVSFINCTAMLLTYFTTYKATMFVYPRCTSSMSYIYLGLDFVNVYKLQSVSPRMECFILMSYACVLFTSDI